MAAQDAELKLKVSLDLGFFRQQLAGLGQAAAGYSMPVQVKFDRRSVQNELNALGANIQRRNYTLNVNTNLKAEIANAKTLAKELENLAKVRASAQGGIRQQMGMGALLPGPQSGGVGSKEVGKLYKAAAKAGLLEFDKEVARAKASMVAALESVGRDSMEGLLNGLSSENEKLKAAASHIGESLIKTIKGVLGIASPSREFKKIGEDAGKGFELGLLKAMELAEKSATSQMRRMLDRLARMALMMGGMSTAEIGRQIGQARALPGVNFPATVPPRQRISIGPSDTGRALPPGVTPGALPGTAFGAQRYLPSALGEEMKRVLREAANTFLDTIRAGIRQVNVRDLGTTVSRQSLLGPGRMAGMLPAAVGREPSRYAIGGESREQMMARRTAEAYARSALRGESVMGRGGALSVIPKTMGLGQQSFMRAPSIPTATGGGAGGGSVPPGGRGGAGGMGGFARAMGGLNLPGAGVIRELGSEFAFATKQVLLFGQAYKLLAFIQSFPAQVGEAVSQLQNFRNTLGAISPTANEAAASNQLILDLVEKYNVPLQSARDGFTKLYASMAPAGFSGDEVRDLFTGITQAAATFGMSADKVDRVNYAFAQMASKGQVMSEELKGQLGDVLPGAMALFAEAAGFKGPKAIQDFSVALEDGAYKGEAMVALLKNVGVIMKQEFGPGAEGAARTFQGVINRMQNSMTLLYESFEPVAVNFLNGVVVPLTAGIKQISDGFNAFFASTAAQTSGGFAIAQELERLRPAFDGIGQNVSALVSQLGQFARIGLEVGKVLLQIAGNPFVGYLARVYINILALTTAIQILNLRALIPMIANFARSTYALITFTVQCIRAGQAVQVTGLMLRTFFATTGVGLVIVGIGLLTERFMSMNQALADTQAKALGAAQAIRSMSQTEARVEGQRIARNTRDLQNLQKSKESYKLGGEEVVPVQGDMAKRLQEGGVGVRRDLLGRTFIPKTSVTAEILRQQGLQSEAETRQRQIQFEEKQSQQPVAIAPIPPSEGDGKKKKGKELDTYDRSQLGFIQQQFSIEKQRLDKRLQGQLISQTEYDISLAELKLETAKLETAEEYRLAVEKTNKDNLSAVDKALKLKDIEAARVNALTIAEEDRNIAVGAARLKITEPILEEIDKEVMAIERQTLQLEALKAGRLELSAAQEAELAVKERYAQLSADEKELAKGEIDLLRQQIQLRIENAAALEKEQGLTEARAGLRGIGGGLRSGFTGSAAGVFERAMGQYGDSDYATKLANIETVAMQLRSVFEGLQGAINGVSSAFANVLTEGIANMISGTATAKEVFASFLQSVGQALSQAASQMIATYIAIGIAKLFAGLGGGGGGGGGSGGVNAVPGAPAIDPLPQLPGMLKAANGAVWEGGFAPFQAFAKGGVVSGPTLGLVGEGKYNEAIVPLPDGKSIPVQLGGRSARDLMGGGAPGMPQAPSLNMKFETTKINGVEYVSREQLEVAMAETRRASISGGARQGMSMTLDRIKQSPSTRSSIGIR
jgi:tape measure domain-containing protein